MKTILFIILTGLFFIMCSDKNMENPFFAKWDTPFQTPPFQKIKAEHYMPAFKKAMEEQKTEINKIVDNPEEPTFQNTIEALDISGSLRQKVGGVFYNLTSAHTNDTLQSISEELSPLVSKHRDDIILNEKLFQRVKNVFENKENLALNEEQQRLLENTYKNFVRGGANLAEDGKAKLREINKELSLLGLTFSKNILKEDNSFELLIDNQDDLAGLTESSVQVAAKEAEERGYPGKWVFTLHKPSLIPFITYSEKRDLREKLYKGYITRGDNNDSLDTKEILAKMVNLRIDKAKLLGYESHADFILEENMAKTPENVYELLNKLWSPALAVAKKERALMQKMIDDEGGDFKLQEWDWWYYAEKIRKSKYNLDEEEVRPYLQAENVINGAFILANKLFGITFEERSDIPKYHPDVKTYEVKDRDGSHIGVYFTDYYYRKSKRGGAWMNEYRGQSNVGSKEIRPIIVNVGNFTKPTEDKPSLLSFDEANTLFHEFGHALHGLLSEATYPGLSGTNVPRDYVEFPSQVMENWVLEPEMLKSYAFHYKTGDVMPQTLIDKIKNAAKFNQGFETVEYLAASFLDMDWHTLTEHNNVAVNEFEKQSLNKIGLIPEIISRYRSTYFRHIFGSATGYSSGYYSYIWSEVLDADCYEAFRENGIFDKKTAGDYRKYILSSGGTEDPMVLYKKFRGREPQIEPLLVRRGLN